MDFFTTDCEIVGSYFNNTAEEVKTFLNEMKEYTYCYNFIELLSISESNGIVVVFLDLSDQAKRPKTLYQIISIARELEQLK